MEEFTFFLLDDRGEEDDFGAEGEFHDFTHNIFHTATGDFAVADGAVRHTHAGKEEAEVIVNLGDGGDGGAGVS